jgi:hypothetical protein
MIKVVSLFKRKKGTTPEQFRHYYENNHVKIFKDLHGIPGYERYVRRYLTPLGQPADDSAPFDVIMENWFTPDRYEAFFVNPQPFDADFLKIVAEDEEKVFDRSQMFVHNVEEHDSDLPGRRPRWQDALTDGNVKKVAVLLKKKDGMSAEEFKDYYENHHVKLVERYLPEQGIIRYSRRYLTPMIDIISGETPKSGIDAITELWFSDDALYERYVTDGACLGPEADALLATDSVKFINIDGSMAYDLVERDTVLPNSTLKEALSLG